MPVNSRVKFGMALTSGGIVAVGAPVALHYTQQSDAPKSEAILEPNNLTKTDTTGEEQKIEESLTPKPRSRRELGEEIVEVVSSSIQPEESSRKEENDRKFEEFWTKITNNYQLKQNENKEQTENKLIFKTELKNVLLGNTISDNEWMIEKEEYKDCSQISGGKTDYCGYLQIKRGVSEYRLKFDRYGKGGSGKKWDVTVVEKNGDNSVKWFSSEKKNWETKNNTDINKFQGFAQSSHNWWSTLTHKSIAI